MTTASDTTNCRFSIFPCGWWDAAAQVAKPQQRPQQTQTIGWVYEYITSERARRATEELRAMAPTATRQQKQDFKALRFEYATFSGIFSYRNARSLVVRSPFLAIDIDDLSSTDEARDVQQRLCQDTHVETALCFVSPKGLGGEMGCHPARLDRGDTLPRAVRAGAALRGVQLRAGPRQVRLRCVPRLLPALGCRMLY